MPPRPTFDLAAAALRRWVDAPRWPSQCAVCLGWDRSRICAPCVARFAPRLPRCRRCALAVPPGVLECGACLTRPPPYERVVAAVDYAYPWNGLITRFKFHDGLDLSTALTRQLRAAVAASDAAGDATLLLPVPLSADRLRERGYNQAWELARRLGAALRLPADPRLLLRIRDTPHQLALPPGERAGNVDAAFAVEPLRRDELQGRVVAVVDDVMTTGATLAEVARTLRAAGALRVDAWVVARTPRPEAA